MVPSPLAGAHAILSGVDFHQHYCNRQKMASSSHLRRRRAVLNYMNMEQGQINMTDPSAGLAKSPVSMLDLVDNHAVLTVVDAVMDGHNQPHHQPPHENGNVVCRIHSFPRSCQKSKRTSVSLSRHKNSRLRRLIILLCEKLFSLPCRPSGCGSVPLSFP